jgi:DNA-directed RNA polymerase specialized sigma24 family protein
MRVTNFPDDKRAAGLLQAWQATGDPDDFRRLWKAASTFVESVVRKDLQRHGIRDPAAAEEAVSLVMNHLRSLPAKGVDCNQTAAGYLVWLSSRRSRDVARSLRRRREVSLDDTRAQIKEPSADPDVDPIEGFDSRAVDHLNAAIKALDARSRLVIERHLAGEPQAVTAKGLGVCDGTITRIRQRAIQRQRELLTGAAIALRHSKPR